MGLALNDILGRVSSYNRDFSREDIAITWINYKSEDKLRHEEILSKISLGKKVSSVLQASILAAMILILVGIFI